MKTYCENETNFQERVRDGHKLVRCMTCGRVASIARKHQVPGATTRSRDKLMADRWGSEKKTASEMRSKPKSRSKVVAKVSRPKVVAKASRSNPKNTKSCRERFILQRLADSKQDKRMECAKPVGHHGPHQNKTKDLLWDQGMQINLAHFEDAAS